MKRILAIVCCVLMLVPCQAKKKEKVKPLYVWSDYSNAVYNYIKNSDEKSETQLIAAYEAIIKNQSESSRGVVPPGIYAEYGYLLLKENKIDEGKAMLKKEIETYPESEVFVSRILKITKK